MVPNVKGPLDAQQTGRFLFRSILRSLGRNRGRTLGLNHIRGLIRIHGQVLIRTQVRTLVRIQDRIRTQGPILALARSRRILEMRSIRA